MIGHEQLSGYRSLRARLSLAYHRSSGRALRWQMLRGAIIGFLLVPILFTFFAGSALLFGYRFTGTFGTSMEPTLRNGDMIWLKHANIAEVMIGDVVMLSLPECGSISHRVIHIEPISAERYLVETKGDANLISEYWIVGPDDMVYILVARISSGGYILNFIDSLYGRIAVVCLGITALIVVRSRRNKTKADVAS